MHKLNIDIFFILFAAVIALYLLLVTSAEKHYSINYPLSIITTTTFLNNILIIGIIVILSISIIIFNLVLNNKKDDSKNIKSVEDAKKSTIAVLTGSSAESLAHVLFKDAEIKTYNLNSDAMYAVEVGNVKYGMALKFAVDDYNRKRDNALMLVGDSL